MSLSGWGSLALGAYTAYTGAQASSDASSASAAGTAVAQGQLDFAKEQYQNVLDIYGPVEQNLSEYYQSLTPEKYEAMGLDAYDNEFKAAETNWDAQMAQRGLSGSGIEAEGIASMNMQKTTDRANISASSESQWAQDQMGWLGLGTGAESVATTSMANSASNLASSYGNNANMYSQQASSAGAGVGSLISGAMYANAYNPGSVNLDSFWG